MWPYIWIAIMLGLVIATVVVAMREKKARTEALKKLSPQPIADDPAEGGGMLNPEDGFGEPDPLDSFGTDPSPEDAFGEETRK